MKLSDFFRPELIIPELESASKNDVLGEIAGHLSQFQDDVNAENLKTVLVAREQLASTAIGDGVAIPHGKLETVSDLVGVLGRSSAGLEFDSIDGKPTHLVFVLVAPSSSVGIHLKALARVSRLFRDASFRSTLIDAPSAEDMYKIIVEENAKY